MKSRLWVVCACFLLLIGAGLSHAHPTYPRLALQQRAVVAELLQFMDQELAEAAAEVPDAERSAVERAEQFLDLQMARHSRQFFESVLQGRVSQAEQLLPELLRLDAARHAQDGADELEGSAVALLGIAVMAELSLDDATIQWLAAQVRRHDDSPQRQVLLHMELLQAGRALRQGQIARTRQILQDLQAQAQQECAAHAAGQSETGACAWLDPGTELPPLADMLTMLERAPAKSLHTAQLAERPLQVHTSFRKCGNSFTWGNEAAAVDPINLAVGTGNLDEAIAHAMDAQILSPQATVDPRLPDLLLRRHGAARIQQEFERASQRIEESTSIHGRIVWTTLFGHRLRLPSSQYDRSGALEHEYTTLAQHQKNLRRSALFRALEEEDEHVDESADQDSDRIDSEME